jgi:hypothetical protein
MKAMPEAMMVAAKTHRSWRFFTLPDSVPAAGSLIVVMSSGRVADEKKSYLDALSSPLGAITERRIVRDDLRQSKPSRQKLPETLPRSNSGAQIRPMVLEQSILLRASLSRRQCRRRDRRKGSMSWRNERDGDVRDQLALMCFQEALARCF